MDLVVVALHSEHKCAVRVDGETTVAKLKGVIGRAFPGGPAPADQRLLFEGRLLHDGSTLAAVLAGRGSGPHLLRLSVRGTSPFPSPQTRPLTPALAPMALRGSSGMATPPQAPSGLGARLSPAEQGQQGAPAATIAASVAAAVGAPAASGAAAGEAAAAGRNGDFAGEAAAAEGEEDEVDDEDAEEAPAQGLMRFVDLALMVRMAMIVLILSDGQRSRMLLWAVVASLLYLYQVGVFAALIGAPAPRRVALGAEGDADEDEDDAAAAAAAADARGRGDAGAAANADAGEALAREAAGARPALAESAESDGADAAAAAAAAAEPAGRFAVLVDAERVIVAFFASLLPYWQPPEYVA
jgi:hypothetical protein